MTYSPSVRTPFGHRRTWDPTSTGDSSWFAVNIWAARREDDPTAAEVYADRAFSRPVASCFCPSPACKAAMRDRFIGDKLDPTPSAGTSTSKFARMVADGHTARTAPTYDPHVSVGYAAPARDTSTDISV